MLSRASIAFVALSLALAQLGSPAAQAQAEDKSTWPVIVNQSDADDPVNAIALECRDASTTRGDFDACLLGAGITPPSPGPNARTEAAASAPPVPTRTPAQAENSTDVVNDRTLFFDPLTGVTGGKLPSVSPDPVHYSLAYEDSGYAITRANSDWLDNPIVLIPGTYSDTTLTVTASLTGETSGRWLALYCRMQPDGSGYALTIAPTSGRLSLMRWDGPYHAVTQLADQQSNTVLRGEQNNSVALTCAGPAIGISVNSTLVASAADTTYGSGAEGIGVGKISGIDGTAEAKFSDLRIEKTEPAQWAASDGNDGPPASPTAAASAHTPIPPSATAGQADCAAWQPYSDPRCTTPLMGSSWCQWVSSRRHLLTDLVVFDQSGRPMTLRAGDDVQLGAASLDSYGQSWVRLSAASIGGWGVLFLPADTVRALDIGA